MGHTHVFFNIDTKMTPAVVIFTLYTYLYYVTVTKKGVTNINTHTQHHSCRRCLLWSFSLTSCCVQCTCSPVMTAQSLITCHCLEQETRWRSDRGAQLLLPGTLSHSLMFICLYSVRHACGKARFSSRKWIWLSVCVDVEQTNPTPIQLLLLLPPPLALAR